MKTVKINENWKFKVLGDNVYDANDVYETSVPASAYSVLLDAGVMPDPYYRDNELTALKLMENDFEFTTSVELSEEQMHSDYVALRFDGLDTLADIYLNGELLGNAYNMHRVWEYDLSDLGRVGTNEIKIIFHSPTKYIREENEKIYTGGALEAMEGFPHLRKCHCMFGWDWGPRLPDAGIYRDVSIVYGDIARIDSVYITQEHIVKESGKTGNRVADVNIELDVTQEMFDLDGYTRTQIDITSPDGELISVYDADEEGYDILIKDAKLWWPAGYGEQPLYKVDVVIYDSNNNELDRWSKRIGLRTMTVNTDDDEWGKCFAHEVNGLKIFAMGADYIPEDNLLSRVTEARTRTLLEDAAAVNHNCIRVWGGGYYPNDFFYDICDELGLIVWQDFMYACASYELDDDFEANIIVETEEVVRRIRHHACLGLWCGNNEMETQTLDKAWHPSEKQKYDYIKLYEYIIPKIVKREDPQAFYWPSSPSAGGNYDNPWNENVGDAHYWDVWHGEKPFTDYRNYYFRYLSEFGFQSFPAMQTIETFTEPEDRNVFSRIMEMHQRNRAANGKIIKYLSATYLYPRSFEMLVYASQLLQMDAIRYGVEHFRRHRDRCMGTVVWQLNDIWPVASWASIDYYGRWKALHYAEAKMFAPIMISAEENGEINLRPYCIEEPKPIELSARLNVCNETLTDVTGEVNWKLCNPLGEVIKSGSESITVPALSTVWMDKLDFSDQNELEINLYYEFVMDGEIVSDGTCIFTAPKHYHFADPELSYVINGDEITISTNAYAQKIMIDNKAGDLRLSDNYFDMVCGSKTVKILSGTKENIALTSVYDI